MACCLSQFSVGVSVHRVVVSVVYMVGGSSDEYALASTVSPKRRRGVPSFFIHLLSGLFDVRQRCPFYVLVCCDVWVVGHWRHWLRSNSLLFCVVCRKCRIWVVCLHCDCSARCFCGFASICPFSFFGIQLYDVQIYYSKSSTLFWWSGWWFPLVWVRFLFGRVRFCSGVLTLPRLVLLVH